MQQLVSKQTKILKTYLDMQKIGCMSNNNNQKIKNVSTWSVPTMRKSNVAFGVYNLLKITWIGISSTQTCSDQGALEKQCYIHATGSFTKIHKPS